MADLSESFVASFAQILNSAQIPCVLWGHYLLNIHGVPSIIGSIDFVIPGTKLGVGKNALARLKGLTSCPDKHTCLASSHEGHTPPPASHFHLNSPEVTVGLYPQSETLWFLPPLDDSLAVSGSLKLPAHLVLASDRSVLPPWRPGRGSGVFKSEGPVIVPKSHILLEAFLRIYARDSGKRIGSFAMAMIGYMEEYVDDDGLLDANKLPEPLRMFYQELREGEKPVRQWRAEFREALGVPEVDSEDEHSW